MSNSENTDPARVSAPEHRVYGIRIRLPAEDSFSGILGPDWESYRWYATPAERDAALAEMRREHVFSRAGDRPTIVCEKVERDQPAEYRRSAAG